MHDAIREDAYKYTSDRITRRMLAQKTLAEADLLRLEAKTDDTSKLIATFWRLCRVHRLDPKTTSSGQLIERLLDNHEFEAYMIAVHNLVDRYVTLHAHLTIDFYEDRGVAYF